MGEYEQGVMASVGLASERPWAALTYYALSIGIFEEVLYRLSVNSILGQKWQKGQRSALLICIFSGLIFGLFHMSNLIGSDLSFDFVMMTLCQCIQCIAQGFMWSAVYLRSRNIFALILTHGLFDLSTFIMTGAESAAVSYDLMGTLRYVVIFAAAGLFYLRKSKTKDLEFYISDEQQKANENAASES